jgi:preprotein translocase subunit SecE
VARQRPKWVMPTIVVVAVVIVVAGIVWAAALGHLF